MSTPLPDFVSETQRLFANLAPSIGHVVVSRNRLLAFTTRLPAFVKDIPLFHTNDNTPKELRP